MHTTPHEKRRAIALTACLLAAFVGLGAAPAETFTIEVPDFERLYGGFIGDTFEATTYDFGLEFLSVTAVTLHLGGFTDVAGSTSSFLVELEGVTTPEVDLFVPGPPSLFPPYEIDIPLTFDDSVLDGMGAITMNVNTLGPGADLSTTVQVATLTFEGTLVPAPPALALLLVGACARRRRAR